MPNTAGYSSVPDYIYGCTNEIWEERGVAEKLRRYYSPDCLVRAPSGLTDSMSGVARDALATLHQFPDRRLVGEDVIWKPAGGDSFLSSHRLISVMRHTGDGRWGAASGRQVKSRIIADCWVTGGVITEEWLVRDGAAFAHCLGRTARDLAQEQLAADRVAGRKPACFTPADDRPSQARLEVSRDPAGTRYGAGLRTLWGDQNLAAIRDLYFAGCQVAVPGGETRNGHDDLDRFAVGLLASIPDARFTLHDVTVLRDAEAPVRVAARWSLDGTHSGWGRFGAPTGVPLHIMALSHAHLTGDRVMAEWLLFDDIAIWTQILAQA